MRTVTLYEAQHLPKGMLRSQTYNALDCIGAGHIHQALSLRMTPAATRTYKFEMAAQVPAFAMTTRGILIDQQARADVKRELDKDYRVAIKAINQLEGVHNVWDGQEKVTGQCPNATRKDGKHSWARGVEDSVLRTCDVCGASRFHSTPFNPGSHPQVARLLYALHGLPKQRGRDGQVTTDDRAIDTLGRRYKRITPVTDAIKTIRGIAKQLGFLKSKLTDGGRFASVFNVGAAWTGRWSSNKNPRGEGGNSQNLAERHRFIFHADPGYELCYMDLKQAESNTVAHLAGDGRYIEAHLKGDVHTYVTRMVWPDLPWTGDDAADAKLAKATTMEWDMAPGHDIRFQAKRLQHGSNYGLTPPGIAAIAHIPQSAARLMQGAYFKAFPNIQPWQRWVSKKVQNREQLVNPLGVEVQLFGRPWDDHTTKQGLAYLPQSTVGHLVAVAAWRIYKELDPYKLQLLAQVHDALLFQYKVGDQQTVKEAITLMTIPCEVTDYSGVTRLMTIEVEASTGANWGKHSEKNPLGLKEFTP